MEAESLLSWVALHPGCELVLLQVSCDVPMRENAFLNIAFHIKETNLSKGHMGDRRCLPLSDIWWVPNQRQRTHLSPLFLSLLPS